MLIRDTATPARTFLTTWVPANFVGWMLGVIVILLLSAVGEMVHAGNLVYLGLGMGWSIGFLQWLVGRRWFDATSQWMWASTLGVGLPFAFADWMGPRTNALYLLPALAGVGGLLAGGLQSRRLLLRGVNRYWWVAASGLAWAGAAALPQLLIVHGHPKTLAEVLRNIAAILFGGVFLGAMTGTALVRLLTQDSRSGATISG